MESLLPVLFLKKNKVYILSWIKKSDSDAKKCKEKR